MNIGRIQAAFNAFMSTVRDEYHQVGIESLGNNTIAEIIAAGADTIRPDDETADIAAAELAALFDRIARSY